MKRLLSPVLSAALTAVSAVAAEPLVVIDFAAVAGRCRITHPSLKEAKPAAGGLSLVWQGEDPQLDVGRTFDMPAVPPEAAAVRFEMETEPCNSATSFEIFHAPVGKGFVGGKAFRLKAVGKSPYTRYVVDLESGDAQRIPAPGRTRFRFDPPQGKGAATVKRVTLSFRVPAATVSFGRAEPVRLGADALQLAAAGGTLRHDPRRMNVWVYERGVVVVAESVPNEPFLYQDGNGKACAIDWTKGSFESRLDPDGKFLDVGAKWCDPEGRVWKFTRRFVPKDDGFGVTTSLSVDRPAQILHVPYLTVVADRASKGHKVQALLPGVEYLADEPSSNEKEIRGPQANRLMPVADKICYPFMLVTQKDHGTALAWTRPAGGDQPFSAVFDTPDRTFASGGHLFGLWAPATGGEREERRPFVLFSSVPFSNGTCTARVRVTRGGTVAEVLETVIRPEDLPTVPTATKADYCRVLTQGWLESEIRVGNQWRHAWMETLNRFGPQPACDVPTLLGWLSSVTDDVGTRERLDRAAAETIAALPEKGARRGWGSGISHVRRPVPPLVYGDLAGFVRTMTDAVRQNLKKMADGVVRYQPGKRNYAETLGSDECNGYTALTSSAMMRAALWTGDETLVAAALEAVDRMTERYRGTVPCGAQPWEMPLHTPDIVGSARLLTTYVDAYLLSNDAKYLVEANYWAWSGMTMVYLQPAPYDYDSTVAHPVGLYATCGVMGATNWTAPNWIGRPVQWCGLVYAAALYDLARAIRAREPSRAAFWHKVADGIAASGLQQCYGEDAEPAVRGLLPDSWDFKLHTQYPVPINPGTLQECAADAIGKPYYARVRLTDGDKSPILHVPGDCAVLPSEGAELRVRLTPWPRAGFNVCVARIDRPIAVRWNGQPVPFDWEGGVLRLKLTSCPQAELVVSL